MDLLDLAVVDGYLASVVHDIKVPGHREYHSPYCVVLGFLPGLLHLALVLCVGFRIYRWHNLVTISFVAGIVQTILYSDFIYYFVKSNQNERIINLPI